MSNRKATLTINAKIGIKTARREVFVAVVTDTQWPAFCAAFGFQDLAADPSLATKQQRVEQRARTIPRIAAALALWTKPALMAKCEALGLPYAPIGVPADLFDDPHLKASGGLVPLTLPDGREIKLPALPICDGSRQPVLTQSVDHAMSVSSQRAR